MKYNYWERADIKEYYKMYDIYKMYKKDIRKYKINKMYLIFSLIPLTHDGFVMQKCFQLPLKVFTHNGLTYDRANSSAL